MKHLLSFVVDLELSRFTGFFVKNSCPKISLCVTFLGLSYYFGKLHSEDKKIQKILPQKWRFRFLKQIFWLSLLFFNVFAPTRSRSVTCARPNQQMPDCPDVKYAPDCRLFIFLLAFCMSSADINQRKIGLGALATKGNAQISRAL